METDNQAIIRELLGRGVMVSPEALEKIKKSGLQAFLGERPGGTCAVVHGTCAGEPLLQCRISSCKIPSSITPDDVIAANNKRYETIRNMLLRKVDATSMSNAVRSTTKTGVVGMVSEITDGGFVLEDTTGTLPIKSGDKVSLDDVIGATGWMRNGFFYAESVIYPDIPINRPIGAIEGTLLLTTESDPDKSRADIVLTPDSLSGSGGDRRVPNPAWVFLENDGKRMALFVYSVDGPVDRSTAVSWLRRRIVGAPGPTETTTERILEEIPDILWIMSNNEPWKENYKGVTMISFGKGHGSLIDLKSRKTDVW